MSAFPLQLPPMHTGTSIGVFGGVYSNYLALEALLQDAHQRGLEQLICLGDLGAFGPSPDRVCDLLRTTEIPVVQGNYDHSIGNGLADCQCGYTDARDNYFAKLSYDYTFANTSSYHKKWFKSLATEIRFQFGPYRVLLCHGSPRKTNEFLWETTTSDAFLRWLLREYQADVIVGTHTGLPWHRSPASHQHFVNCGTIGRPANNGRTSVDYVILHALPVTAPAETEPLRIEWVDLSYDHEQLAAAMQAERLPAEFIDTIQTGWWTTCNEILPAKERARGRF